MVPLAIGVNIFWYVLAGYVAAKVERHIFMKEDEESESVEE